jgi:hypothetical protein
MNSQTNYSTKINFTNPHLHNTTVSRHYTVCYNTNNKKMLRRLTGILKLLCNSVSRCRCVKQKMISRGFIVVELLSTHHFSLVNVISRWYNECKDVRGETLHDNKDSGNSLTPLRHYTRLLNNNTML